MQSIALLEWSCSSSAPACVDGALLRRNAAGARRNAAGVHHVRMRRTVPPVATRNNTYAALGFLDP